MRAKGDQGKDGLGHHEAGNALVRSGPQEEQQEMSDN